MKIMMICTLAISATMMAIGGGRAQEIRIGHLETSDDVGINWLFFQCNQEGASLGCDVFQTLIMRKTKPEDRKVEIDKLMQGNPIDNFNKAFGTSCDSIVANEQKLLDGIQLNGNKLDKRLIPQTKATMIPLLSACKNTTIDSVRKIFESMIDLSINTCRIHSNYSRMKFTYNTDIKSWVSIEEPVGPCGYVTTGILTKDRETGDIFYNYNEKQIRTIPDGVGTFPNGKPMLCSSFQDHNLKYTWRTAHTFEGCTYVESTP
jgi:hypothetical protein